MKLGLICLSVHDFAQVKSGSQLGTIQPGCLFSTAANWVPGGNWGGDLHAPVCDIYSVEGMHLFEWGTDIWLHDIHGGLLDWVQA